MSEENTNNTAQQIGELLAGFEPEAQQADTGTGTGTTDDGTVKTAQSAEGTQPAAAPATDGTGTVPAEPDPVTALQAKVLELEQKLIEAQKPTQQSAEPQAEAWTEQSFVPEDFDPDRLDRDGLNKLLNSVASMVYQTAQEGTVKRVLTSVPGIVKNSVVTHYNIQKAVSEFYSSNEELLPHAKQVGFIAEQLLASEPGLGNDVNALFKKAGEEARKRLGIKPGAKTTTNRGGLTVVQGQGGTPAQALKGIAGEIDAMEAALNK